MEPSPEEVKLGYDKPREPPSVWKFDTTVLSALRGMMGPSHYTFRVTRTSTLTSGTGTLTINTSTNLTQFNEGSALIALFDECKMLKGNMVLQQGTTGGLNGFSEIIGFYPSEDSNTPTLSMVGRLDHVTTTGTGNYVTWGFDNRLRWRTIGRNWGFTVDEGVSSPRIVSGFNGTWKMIVLAGTPSNSSMYFGYYARVIGQFRCRT